MVRASASSSARRAASVAATPRGAPVDPEVSFTKPTSSPASEEAVASGMAATTHSAASMGHPLVQDSIARAPRAAHERRLSASGARGSRSSTP
jgi:hypothetical protein